MDSHLQIHTLRIYTAAMKHSDPLGYVMSIMGAPTNAFKIAPYIAAIRLIDPSAPIPQIPPFVQALAIIAADSARGYLPDAAEAAPIADYQITPASDRARKEMVEWRKRNGLTRVGERRIPQFRSDAENDFTI